MGPGNDSNDLPTESLSHDLFSLNILLFYRTNFRMQLDFVQESFKSVLSQTLYSDALYTPPTLLFVLCERSRESLLCRRHPLEVRLKDA